MTHSRKKILLQDTFRYSFANSLAQGLGVINSIALRRFLGPWMMGVWNILQVILGYCGYASLGTTKALMRDYPYLLGRGEREKAGTLKDLVMTFSMLGSLVPAVILWGYLFFRWRSLGLPLRFGLVFISLFLFLQRFYDIILALLRSEKKFDTLGFAIVINALGGLAATFLLVSWGGLYGLLLGTALVLLLCMFFIERTSSYQFHFVWDKMALKKELQLGIPLILVAFLSELLKTLDRWIIARRLGFYEVGLYSVALMASTYVFSVPMMFSHVWYPNLQEEYGRSGGVDGIKHYLLKPIEGLCFVVPFLYGLAIFTIPILIHMFLPKFVPGIPAMKIYLFGTFFLLLAQFGGNFLITLDKPWVNAVILLLSLALNYLSILLFLNLGWGLKGAALGSVISFAVYGLFSYGCAMARFSSGKEIAQNFLRLGTILTLFYGLAFSIDCAVAMPGVLTALFTKLVLFIVGSLPFLWFFERKTGLLKHLMPSRS